MSIGSRQASHLAGAVAFILAGRPMCRCMSRQAGLSAGRPICSQSSRKSGRPIGRPISRPCGRHSRRHSGRLLVGLTEW